MTRTTWIVFVLFFTCSDICANRTCFECYDLEVPSDCTNVTKCNSGQVCYIEKISSGFHPPRYNIGCRKPSECPGNDLTAIIGKRSTNERSINYLCKDCCDEDFCNAFGCNSLEQECFRKINMGYFYDSTSRTCSNVVKAVGVTFNQSEADTHCKAQGTNIVTINKQDEQDFLLSWIFTHYRNTTDFWTGLKANETGRRRYSWSSGQELTYKNWGDTMKGQPTDQYSTTETCVFIKSTDGYHWYNEPCTAKKNGFICEITGPNTVAVCRNNVFKGYFYDKQSDFCIRLVDVSRPYYDYQQGVDGCIRDHATLVKVDTESKMDFLYRWIFSNKANSSDYWIGARDRLADSSFTWPDGTPVQYDSWGGPEYAPPPHGQPDEVYTHRYSQECVYLTTHNNGEWYDESCDVNKQGFICQYSGSTLKETEMGCFHLLTDGYFFDYRTKLCVSIVTGQALNRDKALQKCRLYNSSLVEIVSENRAHFIKNLIFSLGKNGTEFWIGGKDLYQNGTFYWEESRTLMNFSSWHQLNVSRIKDCVALDHTDDFHWNPTRCASRLQGYICELDKETVVKNSVENYRKSQTTTTTSTTTTTTTTTTSTTTTTTTTTYPTTTSTSSTTTTPTTTPTTTTTTPTTTPTTTTTTTPTTTSTTTPTTTPTTTTTTTTPRPTTETTTPGRTMSPDGYFDISNISSSSFCIKVFTNKYLQYENASSICEEEDAKLVLPTNKEMMADLVTYLIKNYKGISSFYIGLHRDGDDGDFITQEGNQVKYTKWMGGEPTASACVRVNEASGYKWQAIKCFYKIRFICQKLRGC